MALGEFEVSVDSKIGVKKDIWSGEVWGAIASGVECHERKFTPKHLVRELSATTEQISSLEMLSGSDPT